MSQSVGDPRLPEQLAETVCGIFRDSICRKFELFLSGTPKSHTCMFYRPAEMLASLLLLLILWTLEVYMLRPWKP